ncbi:MAG: hypothetical protein LC744_05005 [Chloroflexi bacterium]|nr:hypothetical protein [Chloroflexota bacterium]
MRGRTNFAPRWPTILIGVALTVIGAIGTFGGLLPSVGGMSSQTLGAWSFVAAAAILMLGVLIEGI